MLGASTEPFPALEVLRAETARMKPWPESPEEAEISDM